MNRHCGEGQTQESLLGKKGLTPLPHSSWDTQWSEGTALSDLSPLRELRAPVSG